MAKRQKFPKLPSGYGSIRRLGGKRSLPFAVHPPAKERNEKGLYIRPKALCYVPDWYTGFAVLTAYHAGTYKPGLELTIQKETEKAAPDLNNFCKRVLRDYTLATQAPTTNTITFADVYELFFDWKYGPHAAKQLSESSRNATRHAFKHWQPFHGRTLDSITLNEMQGYINGVDGSKSTVANMINLIKGLYSFAFPRQLCTQNTAAYLVHPAYKEATHGTPLTDQELTELWARWKKTEDIDAAVVLVMCYSGYRKSAYRTMEVNLDEKYFKGGVKNKTSKNRVVPIHSAILPLVKKVLEANGPLFKESTPKLTARIYQAVPEHTPHDTRHTFSRLCEKYGVKEADRKRMLGHSFGSDITNSIHGHRTTEELRHEIEKIKAPI